MVGGAEMADMGGRVRSVDDVPPGHDPTKQVQQDEIGEHGRALSEAADLRNIASTDRGSVGCAIE